MPRCRVSAPAMSNRPPRWRWFSLMKRGAKQQIAAPTGMLTKNTQRRGAPLGEHAPTVRPIAAPAPEIAEKTLSARCARCLRLKDVVIRARVLGAAVPRRRPAGRGRSSSTVALVATPPGDGREG